MRIQHLLVLALSSAPFLLPGCSREMKLRQSQCKELADKADKCGDAQVKAFMGEWCQKNLDKSFDTQVMTAKFDRYLGAECDKLRASWSDFKDWSGQPK